MTKFTTDYVFNTATNTTGMTKNEILRFHLFNSNGLIAKLPDFDDFIHGDVFFTGLEMLYSRHDNFHARWLRHLCLKPRYFTKSELIYHLDRLADDVDKAWKAIAEKKAAA